MSKRPSSAQLKAAVEAVRIYHGSIRCTVQQAQRLYGACGKQVARIARMTGNDETDIWAQLTREASRLGDITPIPGQHI